MRTILFLFPYFGRTGSEVMLLEFIKGLDRNSFKPYIFTFNEEGELINEVPNDIRVYLPFIRRKNIKNWFIRKRIKYNKSDTLSYRLKGIQTQIRADIWYINTMAADPRLYEIARSLNVKIITHIHELPFIFDSFPSIHLKSILNYADYCIGCSSAVCNMLQQIGYNKVQLQYNFIDTEKINTAISMKEITRKDFGIADDEFLWVTSSNTSLLKGIDFLPDIIQELGERKYKIIWIGKIHNKALFFYIKSLLNVRHPGKVIFTDDFEQNDYFAHLNLADGFFLPSRQESFSLAALEAIYLGIPVVSFEYGAASEVISSKWGKIISSLSIKDFANAMIETMETKGLRKNKFFNSTLYFTKNKQLPIYNNMLIDLIDQINLG